MKWLDYKDSKKYLAKTKALGWSCPSQLFLFYYWAANMRFMLHWNNSNNLDSPPAWLNIENASCKSSSLNALLCFPITLSPLKYSDNIIVKNILKIWIQFLCNFGLQAMPLSSPIHFNPLFLPSTLDGAYAYWRNQGVHSVADFFFFRFLQIRDFAHENVATFPNALPPSATDTILRFDVCSKGLISKLINTFVTLQSIPTYSLRMSWSSDLNVEIDQETWEEVLDRVHSSSICARHCLIQSKVVHRVHWSKCKLAWIDPTIDPECDRYHLGPAT